MSELRSVHTCCVSHCSANKERSNTLHTVPTNDIRKRLWESAINSDKPLSRHSRVCSRHFNHEDYLQTGATKRRHLKKTAIPSQNLFTKYYDLTEEQFNCGKMHQSGNIFPFRQFLSGGQGHAKYSLCKLVDKSPGIKPELHSMIPNHSALRDSSFIIGCVRPTPLFSIENIEHCDQSLFYFCGIPSLQTLDILERCIIKMTPEHMYHGGSLKVRAKIVLCLMKMRLSLDFTVLATVFHIEKHECIKYFYDTCSLLRKGLQSSIVLLSRVEFQRLASSLLSKDNANLKLYYLLIVVKQNERTRSQSEESFSVERSLTYSFLMGVNPHGFIVFLSKGAVNNGVLNCRKHLPGVERQDIFSIAADAEIVVLSRDNEHLCIHGSVCNFSLQNNLNLDKTIQKIRNFKILNSCVSLHLESCICDILLVVCGLVNLSGTQLIPLNYEHNSFEGST